jgi:carboxypeptidase C (cathepsin A)
MLSEPLLTSLQPQEKTGWKYSIGLLALAVVGFIGYIYTGPSPHVTAGIPNTDQLLGMGIPILPLGANGHKFLRDSKEDSFRMTPSDIDELVDEAESIAFEIMHKSPSGWSAGLSLHRPRICEDPSNGVKQYSGYLTINSTEYKSFFFWFVEARKDPLNAPTALWFSGGPGASSMFALVGENGPCWVLNKTANGEPSVEYNPFSWTEAANMIWVDQPSGTGFSIGTNSVVKSEHEVADDMYLFLEAFLLQFPQYGKAIYLVGESFGGHYVTSIAHKIVQMNKQIKEEESEYDPKDPSKKQNVVIPLKGIAIGNGMTDTLEQLKWYPLMAFNSTTAPSIINETTYRDMESKIPSVVQAVRACSQSDDLHQCTQAYELYSETLMMPIYMTGANVYDMRLKTPYDFSAMDVYLNDRRVTRQIGARKPWVGVNTTVWQQLAPIDFLHSFQGLIPPILDEGIKVLIYAGDQDYICNWLGVQAWTNKMDWDGHDAFNSAQTEHWTGGTIKHHKNFAFATVANSGHMAPMDQPENSLTLFRALLVDDVEFSSAHFN